MPLSPNSPSDAFDFSEALDAVRSKLGPAPRTPTKADNVRTSSFLGKRFDPAQTVLAAQKDIFKDGIVCWGHLVQANSDLFEKQDKPRAANILFSHSTEIEENPNLLGEVARSLFGLKHTSESKSDVQKFVDLITDERERAFNLLLPSLISGPPEMYFTTFFFDPRHFPDRSLEGNIFPVLRRGEARATVMVPHWYWPDNFKLRYWRAPA